MATYLIKRPSPCPAVIQPCSSCLHSRSLKNQRPNSCRHFPGLKRAERVQGNDDLLQCHLSIKNRRHFLQKHHKNDKSPTRRAYWGFVDFLYRGVVNNKKSGVISVTPLLLFTVCKKVFAKTARHPSRWPRKGRPGPCRRRSRPSRRPAGVRPGGAAGIAGPGRSRLRAGGNRVPARGRP
ncbi:hypothetical protein SAMN04488082_11765 [Desulfomicrobium apsheronum]|uniref:Uncharacterized protein n=1 Tax=Desulfomicrobium apsheronum TaxID=52560 RepID=A0A1I3XTA2_9BACT|nr:hypothetical protein SAMN04488082_11765 [Desulfomicrobium apsheronum]